MTLVEYCGTDLASALSVEEVSKTGIYLKFSSQSQNDVIIPKFQKVKSV
jgi:hypothetical protein